MPKWTADQIPDQTGRTVVVTGANSGIGLAAARQLARHGATLVLAVRDTAKGERAAAEIRSDVATAELTVSRLDLADLASVRAFAESSPAPDVLVNNAGIMAIPRSTTADGFEMQLGTNHLGHFALTGLLLGKLLSRPDPRVVTVSSGAHRMGKIDFDDLMGERSYSRWPIYGRSKLANLLFTYELQRRADAAGALVRAVAAHPGYSSTNLQSGGGRPKVEEFGGRLLNAIVAQSPEMGALPTLFAATVEDLPGGTFVGPDGPGEMRGHPRPVDSNGASKDRAVAERLWAVSEELTGVSYDFAAAGAPV